MKKFDSKKFEQKFLNFSKENRIFVHTKNIIACVSGGVDSMVMLYLLDKYKSEFGINIIVTHFNHLYRGELSDNDQKLVHDFSKLKQLEFFSKSEEVMRFAKNNNISFEMAGRNLRYEFFNEIATKYINSKIATAHIANDNTETILLRIFKGCGLNGLTGIDVKRENIVRPILFSKKAELYEYAKLFNIPYNDDHTNFENESLRNVIRNKIIPVIKQEINPSLDNSLDKLSFLAQNNLSYVKNNISNIFDNISISQTSYEIVLSLPELENLDIAVRNELLLFIFQKLRPESYSFPGFIIMEEINNLIENSSTGKYIIPFPGLILERNRAELFIANQDKFLWFDFEILLEKIYTMEFFIFSSKFIKFDEFSGVNNLRHTEYVDAGKIKGKLKLRHWQKGDRFSPIGSKFTKKLSDFFIDIKLPRFKKEVIPILVDEEKIIWICGYRINNDVKITPETKKIIEFKYKELVNG